MSTSKYRFTIDVSNLGRDGYATTESRKVVTKEFATDQAAFRFAYKIADKSEKRFAPGKSTKTLYVIQIVKPTDLFWDGRKKFWIVSIGRGQVRIGHREKETAGMIVQSILHPDGTFNPKRYYW